jgi:hypothetical protein
MKNFLAKALCQWKMQKNPSFTPWIISLGLERPLTPSTIIVPIKKPLEAAFYMTAPGYLKGD